MIDENLIPKKTLPEGFKQPLKSTKYQSEQNCTWDKWKPPTNEYDEDTDVRKKFERMCVSHSAGVGNPKVSELFGAQSILREPLGSLNRITDVIQRHDPKNSFGARPNDPTMLQALHRIQTESGTGGWPGDFLNKAKTGIIQTIEQLLSKGVGGAGSTNILSQFQGLFALSTTMTQNQTSAQANNQVLPAGTDPTIPTS